MDKQKYEIPEAELLTLQLVDVLAASDDHDNDFDEGNIDAIRPNQFFGIGGIVK